MNPKIALMFDMFLIRLIETEKPPLNVILIRNKIFSSMDEYRYLIGKSLQLPLIDYDQKFEDITTQIEDVEINLISQLLVGLEYFRDV